MYATRPSDGKDFIAIVYAKNSMTAQLLSFLLMGGVAAIVNLISRYILNAVMPFEAAVILAYLLGMVTAYVLFRVFVFGPSDRSVASEFRRFTFVNLFALALVFTVSVTLVRVVFPAIGFTWRADDVAHLIGVLIPAVSSYFGHRLYTFAHRSL